MALLNSAQFLGVINDNVFKFTMAFLLIDTLGKDKASSILSATGAIYVIPFLLFSSSAGILADRFSKQRLLVIMKIAEMIIMLLALFAFATTHVFWCFALLFLLSTHSAIFGPSKYGIIPELVSKDAVSRANGLITSFTYLAIIIGTFLASFLTEITNRHFTWIALFCFLVALGGFLSAIGIQRTKPQGSVKKMNFLFVREIYYTLRASKDTPHLVPAILGSSYFLFIGAFTQLNVIPFAIDALGMAEVTGGYLFLCCALGIALGSYLAGKASKKRIELGLACLAGLGIGCSLISLAIFPGNLTKTIIALIFTGVFGGVFIVPFDTFIQLYSSNEKRGQTIGAANFLAFFGVLLAAFALYFFNQTIGLSPANSFAVIGSLTLLFALFLMARLSDLFLPYISRIIIHRCFRFTPPDVTKIEKADNTLLILENGSWRDALLLLGTLPNTQLLIPHAHRISWVRRLFYSCHYLAEGANLHQLIDQAKVVMDKGLIPCLFLENSLFAEQIDEKKPFLSLFKRKIHLLFVRIKKNHKASTLTLDFSEEPIKS